VNVLFLTKHLRVGGAQRLWAILVEGLRDRGIDARVLTLEDEGEFFAQLAAARVPVACAWMRGRFDLPRLRHALHAGGRPDVVVTHDERSHLAGAWLARRTGAAHVLCDYGSPGFPWKAHRAAVLRVVGPRVAAAVTVAGARNADLAARGVPAGRFHVIPCGVDAARFVPERPREEVRAELGVPPDGFLALLPAVLRPEKQPARFVAAIARANAAEPRVRGVLAGYGPLEAELRAQAATIPAVELLGHRDDMASLVAAADAVCLTSDLEAVPYALLEGMALARPVVAMRAGALAEVVEDGRSGLLVPAGDVEAFAEALVGLARDPARAAALGAAGRERQRARFDAAVMCESYVRLFETLTARSSASTTSGAATSTE
jgi:glycosyltransferase involved in cell wall biosynthesis